MIEIKYFGAVAEKTKCAFEKVTSSDISLHDLLHDLEEKYQFETMTFSVAVNQKIIQKAADYQLK